MDLTGGKMRLLFIILFLPCCLLAQHQQMLLHSFPPAATGWVDNNYPTNISGYPAYTWFVADGYTGSGGSTATWTNYSVEGESLNLTNLATGSGDFPNLTSGAVMFDGVDDYLKCLSYTSSLPHEVIMVVNSTNHATTAFFWSSDSSVARQQFTLLSGEYNVYAGSSANWGPAITNQYVITDLLLNDNNSYLWTNGTSVNGALDTGPNKISGFKIPLRYNDINFGKIALREVVTYRTNLSDEARSNLVYYYNQKYVIP